MGLNVTAVIKKWGPEYVVMLSLTILAYDFAFKDGGRERWTVWDLLTVISLVIFVNWFIRDPVLIELPGSVK